MDKGFARSHSVLTAQMSENKMAEKEKRITQFNPNSHDSTCKRRNTTIPHSSTPPLWCYAEICGAEGICAPPPHGRPELDKST